MSSTKPASSLGELDPVVVAENTSHSGGCLASVKSSQWNSLAPAMLGTATADLRLSAQHTGSVTVPHRLQRWHSVVLTSTVEGPGRLLELELKRSTDLQKMTSISISDPDPSVHCDFMP